MNQRKSSNGAWAVLCILALGLTLALIGLKFRRLPEDTAQPSETPFSATTRVITGK